jgi:hypothetical protein
LRQPPHATRAHLAVLAACLLALGGGILIRPDAEGASIAGIRLPSPCWLRATPLGGCPGCGLSRSVAALCRLRLADSLAFHPAGVIAAAAIILEIVFRLTCLARGARAAPPNPCRWLWSAVLAISLLRWMIERTS